MRPCRLEQVALGANHRRERGDDLLTDRVEWRVGYLREELTEVVEQESRSIRQRRDGCVSTHRTNCLGAGPGHRREDDPQFLVGIPKGLLASGDGVVGVHNVLSVRQRVEVHYSLSQPLAVGRLRGQLRLDLIVLDDASCCGVDEEHATWLEPPLAHDARGLNVEHPRLGGEHHEPVVGHPESSRAQPIAVEHGPDHGAVGERHVRWAVPGLHQSRVELVELAAIRRHLSVVLPRLGDHH
ncbi:unannotated protein [freshwater metagenome]|uniref:Unannotated protein n=1 Tax=freshwater metagenome TaxID=449393 RepID=A0A6J7KA15_9ZZZZ